MDDTLVKDFQPSYLPQRAITMAIVTMNTWGAKPRASTLSDVLEGEEEQHNLTHLVLDWHHVQEAPKG